MAIDQLVIFAALFLIDDCHAIYLWIGRRPTASDNDDPESVVAGTANTRFTAAKICAMRTALDYANGMLPHCLHVVFSFCLSVNVKCKHAVLHTRALMRCSSDVPMPLKSITYG